MGILVALIVVTILLLLGVTTKKGRKIMVWTFVLLMALGILLSYTWPQSERDKAAGSMAHSICSNPAPSAQKECQHPYGFIDEIMKNFG